MRSPYVLVPSEPRARRAERPEINRKVRRTAGVRQSLWPGRQARSGTAGTAPLRQDMDRLRGLQAARRVTGYAVPPWRLLAGDGTLPPLVDTVTEPSPGERKATLLMLLCGN